MRKVFELTLRKSQIFALALSVLILPQTAYVNSVTCWTCNGGTPATCSQNVYNSYSNCGEVLLAGIQAYGSQSLCLNNCLPTR